MALEITQDTEGTPFSPDGRDSSQWPPAFESLRSPRVNRLRYWKSHPALIFHIAFRNVPIEEKKGRHKGFHNC